MRKEFLMSEAQLEALLDACKPTPGMFGTPEEKVKRAWESLGHDLGFECLTARRVPGKGDRVFTAESLADMAPGEGKGMNQEAREIYGVEFMWIQGEDTLQIVSTPILAETSKLYRLGGDCSALNYARQIYKDDHRLAWTPREAVQKWLAVQHTLLEQLDRDRYALLQQIEQGEALLREHPALEAFDE